MTTTASVRRTWLSSSTSQEPKRTILPWLAPLSLSRLTLHTARTVTVETWTWLHQQQIRHRTQQQKLCSLLLYNLLSLLKLQLNNLEMMRKKVKMISGQMTLALSTQVESLLKSKLSSRMQTLLNQSHQHPKKRMTLELMTPGLTTRVRSHRKFKHRSMVTVVLPLNLHKLCLRNL